MKYMNALMCSLLVFFHALNMLALYQTKMKIHWVKGTRCHERFPVTSRNGATYSTAFRVQDQIALAKQESTRRGNTFG